MSNAYLNDALSFYKAEMNTRNGQEYKPDILYEKCIAIQHYFRQSGRFVSFLDDVGFEGMRRFLDAKMKDLSKQGLGQRTISPTLKKPLSPTYKTLSLAHTTHTH